MDKKKIMQERHDLLLGIQNEFQEELIAASLMKGGDGDDTEVLRVILPDMGFENEDGGVGEFFFAPIGGEEDQVTHFVSAITLADDCPGEHLEQMTGLMAVLNCYLPCGCFCINRDRRVLMYKLVTPISVELAGETLKEQIDICMANAVAVCDRFSDLVIRVLEGGMEPEEALEAIGI